MALLLMQLATAQTAHKHMELVWVGMSLQQVGLAVEERGLWGICCTDAGLLLNFLMLLCKAPNGNCQAALPSFGKTASCWAVLCKT